MYQFAMMPPVAHHDLAHSALPDAPVVPERRRRHPFRRARHALASGLHATARAVEPAPAPPRRPPSQALPGVCA